MKIYIVEYLTFYKTRDGIDHQVAHNAEDCMVYKKYRDALKYAQLGTNDFKESKDIIDAKNCWIYTDKDDTRQYCVIWEKYLY